MRILFLFSWALVVAVALLPLAYFLSARVERHEAEFIDKAHDQTRMDIYFKKFWLEGWTRYQSGIGRGTAPAKPALARYSRLATER